MPVKWDDVKAFGSGALDDFLFNIPSLVADKAGSDYFKKLQEQNKTAYEAGQIASMLGGMLIPGGVATKGLKNIKKLKTAGGALDIAKATGKIDSITDVAKIAGRTEDITKTAKAAGKTFFDVDKKKLIDSLKTAKPIPAKNEMKAIGQDSVRSLLNMGAFQPGIMTSKDEIQIIQNIIKQKKYPYKKIGIRIVDDDFDDYGKQIGETLSPSSVWKEGEYTNRKLSGTSAISASGDMGKTQGYWGRRVFIIGSDEARKGSDPGEIVMKAPKILDIIDLPRRL